MPLLDPPNTGVPSVCSRRTRRDVSLIASNMFLRPTQEEVAHFTPEWHINGCAPGFKADPDIHGTRQSNFAVLDFTHKRILRDCGDLGLVR